MTTDIDARLEGIRFRDQEFVTLDVTKVRPHPYNPNEGDEASLAASVDEVGFYGAVLVRQHPDEEGAYQLLGGEHRWKLAVRKGETEIPGILIHEVDDVEALKILVNDNEVTRRGQYNRDAFDKVIDALGQAGGSALFDSILDAAGRVKDAEDAESDAEYSDPSDLEDEYVREYGILIMAESELEQQDLFEQLAKLYGASKLRVVSV